MLLFLVGFFTLVALSEARYTCTYIDEADWPWEWDEMKTRQCDYGCCGQKPDYHCCDEHEKEEEEYWRKHWIIVASVAGGVAVICLIIVVVLCVMKAKNVRRSRICDGREGTHRTRINLASPPPPYHPVNIYIVDGDRDRQRRVVVPSSNSTQDPPTRQDDTGQEQNPPVFNGAISSPPPYSYVDTREEWKQWENPPPKY